MAAILKLAGEDRIRPHVHSAVPLADWREAHSGDARAAGDRADGDFAAWVRISPLPFRGEGWERGTGATPRPSQLRPGAPRQACLRISSQKGREQGQLTQLRCF